MKIETRRLMVLVLAVLLFVAGVTSLGSSKPQLSEQRILQIALKFAAANKDRSPTLIQHSAGPHYRADVVGMGDGTAGDQWAYLIAERGHFVAEEASPPVGAALPRGTVLTMVVNANTGHLTDFGVSNRYPDLAKLGSVHTDLGRPTAQTAK